MEDDSDNEHRALLGWILGIAVALSITIALTTGIVATSGGAPAKAPAKAPAPTAAPAAPSTAKLYFASGSVALPDDAAATLAPLADAAKARADAKLVISGFHDKTGNPEQNAELAKQRATATRDALVAAGVAAERIELRKPAETEGGGNDREARRVEVSIE
jgi:K(+)-stimulated pyrophosphate-energized sodium pump